MDIQLAIIVSLIELVIWTKAQGPLRFAQLLTVDSLTLFVLYFIAQYSVLKFYRFVVYPHFISPLRNIPGPKDNHPLIGQFGKILTDPTPNDVHLSWHEKWPREPFIRFLSLGNQEQLMMNTPEAYKEVLQTHCYSFKKPDLFFRMIGDFIGRGLLFQEGAEHKTQKRILMETFTLSNLKRILPVIQSKSKNLAGLFGRSLDEHGKGVVDVVDCYDRLGMDVIGAGVLGVELENLTSSDSDKKLNFLACYNRLFSPPRSSAIITAINAFVPIRGFLPIEANLGYLRAARQLRDMLREVVRQRVIDVDNQAKDSNLPLSTGMEGRDLLTMMVQHRRKSKGTEDELSEENIVDQILTFLGAGYETVSSMSAWASYAMAVYPSTQEKLRDEITGLLARTPKGEIPTWEEIDKLHYLNNFCKEALRLYCPIVQSSRESLTDLTICGTFIPAGTTIFIQPAVTNRSKTIWGPTADDFIPERWEALDGADSSAAASPYAWNPFLNGPRMCIGKGFALMEAKAQLVEVVSQFRFVLSPELEALEGRMPLVQNPALTLQARGGLRVGVERI